MIRSLPWVSHTSSPHSTSWDPCGLEASADGNLHCCAVAIRHSLVHMSADRPLLLLVEDEVPIRAGLLELFHSQGFDVVETGDGNEAMELAHQHQPDAVLLDWMLPGVQGIDVLRHLRQRRADLPILLLTARSAEEDVVAGLEAGADDYVTKPFGIHELVARVKGLLRRRKTDAKTTQDVVVYDDATLDFAALNVRKGGVHVRLTAREAALLQFLFERQQRPVPRDELLVHVWGYRDGSIQTRTVDVHMQQLRAKLASIGGDGWLQTVRGRGYRFGGELP
jgi:two-component system, OmpR family, phosphate regulon response regulator PhoB